MEGHAAAELGGDRPKERLGDDKLGHAAFARAIARSIAAMTPKDGMVLAINGPWGSGKTSAANMVVDALSELEASMAAEKRTVVARFNPWWFSGQENLVRAFFDEVSATLEKTLSKKVFDALKSVGRRVSGARDLVLAGTELAPGGAMLKGVAAGALSVIGRLAEEGGSLSSERAKLCEALREQDRRILVVIDDVDRLPADEALQVFRLVKSVADLPNVIHLLLFDREAARRAVGQPAEEGGPEWLEKIVQVSFDLPPVLPTDMNRLFLDGLSPIARSLELPDPIRWQNTFHDAVAPWLRTPRDVGRLVNALAVTWPAVSDDVDFADFVGLEAMRLFEPRLHSFVREHPEELTGLQSTLVDADPALGEQLLGLATAARRGKTRKALERLFPRLESVWSKRGYAPGFLSRWDRERRACSPRRFASYFTLSVGDGALSRADFDAFVAVIADAAAVRRTVAALAGIERAAGGTKAAVLLDELSSRPEEVPLHDIPSGVANLMDVYDLFANPADERGGGFLAAPVVWRLWWATNPLLERLDGPAREAALRHVFLTVRSLYVLCALHDAFKSREGEASDPDHGAREPDFLEPGAVKEFGDVLVARIRDAARDGSLRAQEGLMQILRTWVDLAGSDEVREWTSRELQDDRSVLLLAKAATYMSRVHVEGDRVSSTVPRVSMGALARILDVDRLVARLAVLAGSGDEPAVEIAARFSEGADRSD